MFLWLKAGYFAKRGTSTLHLEEAAKALSDIELQAALQYWRSRVQGVLDIPVYLVQFLDHDYDGIHRKTNDSMTGSLPLGLHSPATTKMAAVSKRGTAQPRRRNE